MINVDYLAFFAASITLAVLFDLVAQSFGALTFGMKCITIRFLSAIYRGESRPRFIREIILGDSPPPCELVNVIRVAFNTLICILTSYIILDGVTRLLNLFSLLLTVTLVPFVVGKFLGTKAVKAVCYIMLLPLSVAFSVLYYPLALTVLITKKCKILLSDTVYKVKKRKKKSKSVKNG